MATFSRLLICGFAGLCLGAPAAQALEALDDGNLSSVTGANNGIAFNLYMQINTDPSGNPVNTTATNNTGCATNANPCSYNLAVQLENRPGAWLVLKDYFGMLSIPDLQLDAYVNPQANTSYWNKNRFVSSPYQATQTCVSDIQSCNPAGMGSFSFSFPGTTSNYGDIGLYLNVGRMAVEFDTSSTACPTVNSTGCGWNQDSRGSFAGLIVSDTANPTRMSQINFNGQVRVYGF